MTSLQLVWIALAGLSSGAINAVAGGGSLVLFPALVACGLTPLQANVTNSMANWPGYLGGVLGFRQDLRDQRPRMVFLASATVLGSSCGCALLLTLPASAFNHIVPVLVLFASLLLALQPTIRRRVGSARGEGGWALYGWIVAAALYGGYFGGALGVILLATLGLNIQDSLRRLNALKAYLSLLNGTICLVAFAIWGPVDWKASLVAAPATLLGGYLGARLARHIPERLLRACIVTLGIAVSAYLAWPTSA